MARADDELQKRTDMINERVQENKTLTNDAIKVQLLQSLLANELAIHNDIRRSLSA